MLATKDIQLIFSIEPLCCQRAQGEMINSRVHMKIIDSEINVYFGDKI